MSLCSTPPILAEKQPLKIAGLPQPYFAIGFSLQDLFRTTSSSYLLTAILQPSFFFSYVHNACDIFHDF
jgi:hypothetical protein